MTRTILTLLAVSMGALVAACPDTPPPSPIGVCEALRPDMPVKYHGNTTDAVTTANIRRANARFRAACPDGAR